jgi:hypothetical protein
MTGVRLRGRNATILGLATALALIAAPAYASARAVVSPTARTAIQATAFSRVAVIVPITVPPTATGLIDAETLATYTSSFGVLTRQLDAVVDRPVALAIDPMVIVSIRILGDEAPESATAWLSRLADAPNETFALQWSDADLTIPLQSGEPKVLEPLSLDYAINPDHFSEPAGPSATPTNTETPIPTATPAPGPPPLPTTESLLDWPFTIDNLAWPRASSVVADDISALKSAGFTSLILSSSNVSTGSHQAAVTVSDLPVIVSNESVANDLGEIIRDTTSSTTDAIDDVNGIRSRIINRGTLPTVIALDRAHQWTEANLGAVIDALFAGAAIEPATLVSLAGSADSTAKLRESPQSAGRIADVSQILKSEKADALFATIAEDPLRITAQRRLQLLATLSNSWAADTEGWALAKTSFTDASTALRGSVRIVKSSSILLLADRSTVPVVVENGLDQPVTVFISVRPTTPMLIVENPRVEITIDPETQRKALVPVQSVSNGEVDLRVGLHRADDGLIGSSKTVRITVQAGWETPVTLVIAILVVVIFVLGFYRTILKRRRLKAANDD